MMFTMLKDLFSIPVVSGILLAIFSAISKKYIQFSRRDFFSRSPVEQITAVKWLRQPNRVNSDPLALAEEQFNLQSFGLHSDWSFSYRLIAFSTSQQQTSIRFLKTVLRWSVLYYVANGRIYLHNRVKWVSLLVLSYILFIMGGDTFKSYLYDNTTQFFLSLAITLFTFLAWLWIISRVLIVFWLSKKLNAYTLPITTVKFDSGDFSSILNNSYR